MPHVLRNAEHASQCEECQRIHEGQLRKLQFSTLQQSRTVNEVQKSRSWLVLGRVERRLREPYIEREQFEYLEPFLKVLQTRCGPFQCTVTKKSACAKLYTVQQGRLGNTKRSDRS